MRSEAEILWSVASGLARDRLEVSRDRMPLPALLFLTDPERTPRPWETAARLPAGSGVVYRHFGASGALETAHRLRETTTRSSCRLLIGLDVALAAQVGADGVHLPERALSEASPIRAAYPDWMLTGAVHGEVDEVLMHPLDAVVLSPVFPASGASAARPALGLAPFTAICRSLARPAYALGGIDATNAGSLTGSGACGLAGVSAIQSAFGPD